MQSWEFGPLQNKKKSHFFFSVPHRRRGAEEVQGEESESLRVVAIGLSPSACCHRPVQLQPQLRSRFPSDVILGSGLLPRQSLEFTSSSVRNVNADYCATNWHPWTSTQSSSPDTSSPLPHHQRELHRCSTGLPWCCLTCCCTCANNPHAQTLHHHSSACRPFHPKGLRPSPPRPSPLIGLQ